MITFDNIIVRYITFFNLNNNQDIKQFGVELNSIGYSFINGWMSSCRFDIILFSSSN